MIALALALFSAIRARRATSNRAIALAALLGHYPEPLGLSPDGEKLLFRSIDEEHSEIRIRTRVSGAEIFTDRSPRFQRSVTWRPDSGALAFLEDQNADSPFRLILIDLDKRTRVPVDAPPTLAASLQWAPVGGRLAYVVQETRFSSRRIFVVDREPDGFRAHDVGVSVDRQGSFAWSQDGTRLALIADGARDRITIVRADGAATPARPEEISIGTPSDGWQASAVTWSKQGDRLLAAGRGQLDEFTGLVEVSLRERSRQSVGTPKGDVSSPAYLPDDSGFLFALNQRGEETLWRATGSKQNVFGPPAGSSVFLRFSADKENAYVLNYSRTRPVELESVQLASGAVSTISAAPLPSENHAVGAEQIEIAARDGLVLPVSVWRSPTPRGVAVLWIHGGPAAQTRPAWDGARQMIVGRGAHLLAINYRGSTGYGRAFENAGSDLGAQVSDVLASRDFVTQHFGVPKERIIAFGESYGACLVAIALAREQDAFGGTMLLSTMPCIAPPTLAPSHPPRRLVAFHGERDPLSPPSQARTFLEATLGTAGNFTVLAGEGHIIHSVSSWARTYEVLLDLIDEVDTASAAR